MIILRYPSKKVLQEKVNSAKTENRIGLPLMDLRYDETSMFGTEVKNDCRVAGSNRPSLTGITELKIDKKTGMPKRVKAKEFFASLTIENGYVIKVS